MKTIRFLLILVLSTLGFAPAAFSAEPLTSTEQKLVGTWEEYEPSSNVVRYYSDRTIRLYLTEEEGSDTGTHYIEGSWSISPDSTLTMNLSANGRSLTQTVKVVFKNDEMWLVDEEKGETKHRRLAGDIPEKYRW